jgi:hypothetical protein
MFLNVHTLPLPAVINITVHTLFPSTSRRGCDCRVDIVFRFRSFTPKVFFHTLKQPLITLGEIRRVRRMYQHLPAPALQQILHITMAMRCCIVLEQSDTILTQFSFTAKYPTFLYLQECTVILAIDRLADWHGMVKQKSNQLKNMTCVTFRARSLRRAVFFLCDIWAR